MDYEERRENVIEEQNFYEKKFLEEGEKLDGKKLLVNKIVEGIHKLNKDFEG